MYLLVLALTYYMLKLLFSPETCTSNVDFKAASLIKSSCSFLGIFCENTAAKSGSDNALSDKKLRDYRITNWNRVQQTINVTFISYLKGDVF